MNPSVPAGEALPSFPPDGIAVVVGAGGGIGAALCRQLAGMPTFHTVLALHRRSDPPLDLRDEASIAAAAAVAACLGPIRLLIDATGVLHSARLQPEKTWRSLDPAAMAEAFAVNAIGPALLMKHFLPLLATPGKAVFGTLSAKVGSIGDNRLGGWYSYRASKAALNQLVRTAAIELRRRRPEALCVALHPGTVDTPLSAPFARSGLEVQSPDECAQRLLATLDALGAADNGGFFSQRGEALPW